METDQEGPDVDTEISELRTVVGDLANAVGGLAAGVQSTREQLTVTQNVVRSQARLGRGQRFVTGVLAALVALAIAGGAYYVTTTNDLVHKLRSSQLTGQRTQQQIEDCLLPTGTCYQEQQRRTAAIVGAITDANHNQVPDVTEILRALSAR